MSFIEVSGVSLIEVNVCRLSVTCWSKRTQIEVKKTEVMKYRTDLVWTTSRPYSISFQLRHRRMTEKSCIFLSPPTLKMSSARGGS